MEMEIKRITIIVLIIVGLLWYWRPPVLAQGSNDLIEKGAQWDRKMVTYEGEVIREPMRRGDYAWLNVSDGNNAMGVWVKYGMIRPIRHYGSYKMKGDWIKVTGLFYRSCPEHGGDLDIHASSITVLKRGGPTSHPIRVERLLLALLAIAAGIFYLLQYLRRNFTGNKL